MAIQQLGNDRTTVRREGLDLIFERVFDAPRDLVWEVMTDPDRIRRWWGPHGTTTEVVELDLRVGGRWAFVSHAPDRDPVPFSGEYLEVVPPERIVRTFRVDLPGFGGDEPGRETMTLEDLDGRTRLRETGHFRTEADLEFQISVGMIGGALEQYDRLAEEIALG